MADQPALVAGNCVKLAARRLLCNWLQSCEAPGGFHLSGVSALVTVPVPGVGPTVGVSAWLIDPVYIGTFHYFQTTFSLIVKY